tara:strand:- start:1045 stop:1425 length:381 start_codon:yes stop_codon:yes gene_type:complete
MNKKYTESLNSEERSIMVDAQTETPFSGEYNDFSQEGIFVCKACGFQLFLSDTKFNAHCGWPSFDDAIKGAILRKRDVSLGRIRTEILCANCEGHLGHVFEGENYTDKNTRYCVNSLSLKFITNSL